MSGVRVSDKDRQDTDRQAGRQAGRQSTLSAVSRGVCVA